MTKIHIKNGHVIDPANNIDALNDVFITDGKITAVGKKPTGFTPDTTIDASKKHVVPGLVDLSARCREPGESHKGTIESETRAAAFGGITTLCLPPDTKPVIDTPAVMELIHQRSEKANFAKIVMLGALTKDLKNEQLSEIATLKAAGCVGISNADSLISNTTILRHAMEYVATHDLTLFLNPQDAYLTEHGCVNEGEISIRLGLVGIPTTAETIAVSRDLLLIEQTGVRAHFCQLSSAPAVQLIADAINRGLPITADVSAHQLHLTEHDIGFFDPNCHVFPPLRTERDKTGLRQALQDQIIAAICSDHQPHDVDAKLAPFAESEPGISTLETLLPLSLRLAHDGILTLPQVINCLTKRPADIIGIDAGSLTVGSAADVCIFDNNTSWIFKTDKMISHGHNSPFDGWEMIGKVCYTLLNGEISYQEKN
ncbi:MAG: dihydroorotase [Gammaproteobacteria bacterium]